MGSLRAELSGRDGFGSHQGAAQGYQGCGDDPMKFDGKRDAREANIHHFLQEEGGADA